jgi:hypothetical protein
VGSGSGAGVGSGSGSVTFPSSGADSSPAGVGAGSSAKTVITGDDREIAADKASAVKQMPVFFNSSIRFNLPFPPAVQNSTQNLIFQIVLYPLTV